MNLVDLDPALGGARAARAALGRRGRRALSRIKEARPSVRWLSSAECHERTNAVRPLLRLWLPAEQTER